MATTIFLTLSRQLWPAWYRPLPPSPQVPARRTPRPSLFHNGSPLPSPLIPSPPFIANGHGPLHLAPVHEASARQHHPPHALSLLLLLLPCYYCW